jgi:hypothetical protein
MRVDRTAVAMNGNEKARHAIGVDPGTSSLSIVCVRYDPPPSVSESKLCDAEETRYTVLWGCVVDLSSGFVEPDSNDVSISKYPKFSSQTNALDVFLKTNDNFNASLRIKGIEACVEQQEGVRNPDVLFALLRVNFFSGYVCSYIRSKGVPVHFVPKTYKYGWSFLNALSKKTEPVATPEGKKKNKKKTAAEISRGRTNRKKAICALARETIKQGGSSSEIEKQCESWPDSRFNHFADSMAQAMLFLKENGKRSDKSRSSNKNAISREFGKAVTKRYEKTFEKVADRRGRGGGTKKTRR